MKRSTTAVIVGVLALGLVGGGTAVALTSNNPEAVATDAPTASPEPTTPEPETTPADDTTEPLSAEDEAYLAEVEDRMIPGSILDQFTDSEIIAMGHEACRQIGNGADLEALQLVKGEKRLPDESGTWRDSSAVFNAALLNYCRDLLEPAP